MIEEGRLDTYKALRLLREDSAEDPDYLNQAVIVALQILTLEWTVLEVDFRSKALTSRTSLAGQYVRPDEKLCSD